MNPLPPASPGAAPTPAPAGAQSTGWTGGLDWVAVRLRPPRSPVGRPLAAVGSSESREKGQAGVGGWPGRAVWASDPWRAAPQGSSLSTSGNCRARGTQSGCGCDTSGQVGTAVGRQTPGLSWAWGQADPGDGDPDPGSPLSPGLALQEGP